MAIRNRRIMMSLAALLGGCLMGTMAMLLAWKKLVGYGESFGSLDILQVIFYSDQQGSNPYINVRDISGLFTVISYYLVMVIIVCGSFLLKPKNYNIFLYSRAESKARAIKLLKGQGLIFATVFAIGYHLALIIALIVLMPKGVLRVWLYLMMHFFSSLVYIALLRQISMGCYFLYGITRGLLFTMGLVVVTVLIDLVVPINIILFDYQYMFVDSLAVCGCGLIIIKYGMICLDMDLPYQ